MEPVGGVTRVKGLAGPAKWAAVSIVSALAGAGLTYSLVTRGPSPEAIERPVAGSGSIRPSVSTAEPSPPTHTASGRSAHPWMPGEPLEPETQPTTPPKALQPETSPGDAAPADATPVEPEPHNPEPVRPSPAPPRRLNINTATQAELELLPGIGPAMAKAILDHRRAHGPFRSIAALDDVKGIGPRTLERLAPLITVD